MTVEADDGVMDRGPLAGVADETEDRSRAQQVATRRRRNKQILTIYQSMYAQGLTPQTEVLRQLCRGLSNKEISRALDLSEKTTKSHVTAIFKALSVVNRTQAASAARRAGIVTD